MLLSFKVLRFSGNVSFSMQKLTRRLHAGPPTVLLIMVQGWDSNPLARAVIAN
jgi:hypothetical protein